MTNLTGVSLAGAGPRGDKNPVKLGRYEVVRELGKGAMGIVYLAKDPLIGRLVALKTIRTAAHADDDETKEFQQRFVREAQAAGILNHPAIVTVHDIGQDDTTGTSFIAMEYVEGQNLKEMLAQGRPLNFDQIGDIIAQVAEGLDFAHAKGIVHRDVKPANIILIDGMRAKITDFGIAKIASGAANLTSTGQFLGTPNYMAPEQIKGAPVDGRTDIFSLGICLYECLTRRKPFGGDSLTSISYKIVHEPFPPLHDINPLIPDGYEEVVAHCLEKDPAKRFQRGRDLANALRAVIRGERPVRPSDPMLNDATIVTRSDHDKLPTVEIPFPEAEEPGRPARPASGPLDTNPSSGSMPAVQQVPPRVAPAVRRPASSLRTTLDGVAALPLWRRTIPAPVFFAIILVLLGALAAAASKIHSRYAPQRVVDVRAERKHATERQLRMDANQLLHEGRVDDAYAKYEQLSRMAPGSPAVTTIMQKLASIRQQQQLSQQQVADARAKFDQGRALYDKRQYADAEKLFAESYQLNPNSEEVATFLKLAQEQQTLIDQQNQQRTQQKQPPRVAVVPPPRIGTVAATTTHPPVAVASGPAQLTTFFNSPFSDGYMVVKVGSDNVTVQQLWEEQRHFLAKRKVPRVVNVTNQFTPKNADVVVYINVPAEKITEQHVIPRQNFQPGTAHKLVVSYDANAHRFDYQLN